MNLLTRAGAKSFVHMIGLNPAGKRAEEDEEDKKARRAEEPRDEDDADEASAEDEDGEGDEDGDKDKKGKKAKKAKKPGAEDDDGDAGAEGDDDDDSKEKAAAKRERARCARIIAHGIKHGCVNQAGVFAFDTDMPASAAISALDAGAIDGRQRGSLAQRMATVNAPAAGPSSAASAPTGADAILAALEKARGTA